VVDHGGRWWLAYHAIVEADPFFATRPGFTRRPPMLDPVVWADDWPVVRLGPSATRMPAPAGRPGQRSAYRPPRPPTDRVGDLVPASSDGFDGDGLDPRWSWVREPEPDSYAVEGGTLRLPTAGRLAGPGGTATLPTLPAPQGNFVAETTVHLDVPATGEDSDGVQAGLVVYASDDRFVKLVHAAVGGIRVTSLGREVDQAPAGWPRYGASTAGPPGDTTRLRLVRRTTEGRSTFRAWTRSDAGRWVRGPAWSHPALGSGVRIGLLATGPAGHTAVFDDLTVSRLAP
jgi:arabinan endo-1,5-alpha-L-arabinosidase